MNKTEADRLSQLPPYLFVEIDRQKRAALSAGRDVIDFGMGDPDSPTPDFIVERMAQAVADPDNQHYAAGIGTPVFREAVVQYFNQRYGIALDPDREVVALLGSKEGIGHLPLAVVNPGDIVLVPEPGYPVYASGAILAGGVCSTMPLSADNNWLPDFESIPRDVLRRARLMWLNYPNNPTAAVAPLSFFEEAVAVAREYGILIAQDAAYSELFFDERPPSILQVAGAGAVAVEFHSLSKTFNMTGWRAAFVVGNPDVLAALTKVKSNLDSGMFGALQLAAAAALSGIDRAEVSGQNENYRRRRDVLVTGLRAAGWSVDLPAATFYVWARCPSGCDSVSVALRILNEADVVTIPGAGFGPAGEGFIRFALTVGEDRTREAARRIAKLTW